jgi:hypothetical protein
MLGEPLTIFTTLLFFGKPPKNVHCQISVNWVISRPNSKSANPDQYPLRLFVYEPHQSDLFVSLNNVVLVNAYCVDLDERNSFDADPAHPVLIHSSFSPHLARPGLSQASVVVHNHNSTEVGGLVYP